ncbi:WUSCHEL-related homeobox 13-like [Euphorbia lathyris]|uniref:WUSCHEL-related homeobox 13-like n=1 Tax=Euphorbia lathyris TaxID=212925 RepID=UPI0033137566
MEKGGPQSQNPIVGGVMKVMSDEQLELLRKQICVYVSISESLVQMHKSLSTHQDFTGMRVPASPYNTQLMSYAFHKLPARQRWAPKPAQLEILERVFDQSSVTPDRQRIKEITSQIAIHGPVSETNVYNWFQNRRARSKRKQQLNSNGEFKVGTEISESEEPKVKDKEKKIKSDDSQIDENLAFMVKQMYYQSPEMGGIDQLIGKTEVPLGYNSFWQIEHDSFT